MAQLLGSVVLLIVGLSLSQETAYSGLARSVLLSLTCVMALLAIGGRRETLARGTIFLAPVLISQWYNHVQPDLLWEALSRSFALVLLAFVVAHLFRFIVNSPRVNTEVLYAGIATYLLLGIFWASGYMLLSLIRPTSFSEIGQDGFTGRLDIESAIYFSFVTMATVGYGDIVPRSPLARTAALLQGVVGTFYMAILIARLVAQYTSEKHLVSSDSSR